MSMGNREIVSIRWVSPEITWRRDPARFYCVPWLALAFHKITRWWIDDLDFRKLFAPASTEWGMKWNFMNQDLHVILEDIVFGTGPKRHQRCCCWWCWCCCYQICDLLRLFHFTTDRRQTSHTHNTADNITHNRTVTDFQVKS